MSKAIYETAAISMGLRNGSQASFEGILSARQDAKRFSDLNRKARRQMHSNKWRKQQERAIALAKALAGVK